MSLLSLLVALSCYQPSSVATSGGVSARAPDASSRIDVALGDIGKSSVRKEIGELLERTKGKVMVDAPDKIGGLAESVNVVPMYGDADMKALWWGTDEQAVWEKLKADGVNFVLVNRKAVPSADRGKRVASRLYHDDYRTLFTLLAVDEGWKLYLVTPNPVVFPSRLASAVTSQVRRMLGGHEVARLPAVKTEDGRKWNMIMTAREPYGRELAIGMCYRSDFNDCVAELATDLEREHRRYAEWNGLPKLRDRADEIILEVHRVTERATIYDHDDDDLNELFEMGIDGAIIIDREIDKAATVPGSVSYTRSYRTADQMLRNAARDNRLSSKRPWRDAKNSLEKIRTIHYMDWPGKGFVPLFRGVAPVPMEVVDLPALEESVVMGGEWYMRNLAPFDMPLKYQPGQVTYKMWPSENRYSDEYNLVRHTLATWNLVLAYNLEPRPEFLEGARAALEWTLTYQKTEVKPDGTRMTFIEYPGDQDPTKAPVAVEDLPSTHNRKLGSVVVGLMGIIDLARATDDHQWDALMLEMGEFILHMQDAEGKFIPYYVPPVHPYADERNDIVPGEAALALIMLHEYTGDDKWLEPIPRYFTAYEPWWDEREARKRTDRPWPVEVYDNQDRLDLVQFGPWSVMAANAYHKATGREEGVDFAMKIGRWMVDNYMWTQETAPWPDYVGGYYKMPGELPAMQAFCYAEGTAAAYQLAQRARPESVEYFELSTREAARFGLQMQYDELQTYPFSRGDEVYGGTRYAMNETKVRIDYVHHQLSALYQYVIGARLDPNLPEGVKLSPVRVKQLEMREAYEAEWAARTAPEATAGEE